MSGKWLKNYYQKLYHKESTKSFMDFMQFLYVIIISSARLSYIHSFKHYKQWRQLNNKPGPTIRERLMVIGDTIWYSASHKTHYEKSENGMVQYSIKDDKIISIIQYPQNINPHRQCCCKYKDKIYIIDGENGEIILFDPSTKKYIKKRELDDIPPIGRYPSAVVVFDKIHILHGNRSNNHYIYNPENNEIQTLPLEPRRTSACLLNYENKIITFGGWDLSKGQAADEFIMSSEMKSDDDDKIAWINKKEFKLIKGLNKSAHILFGQYVIMFGGNEWGGEYTDCIYLLDLESNEGWIELKHIKCPLPGRYLAVLTEDNWVHLITEVMKWPKWEESVSGHYAVPISTILGSKFSLLQNKVK